MRTAVRVASELALTAGLVLALFVAYQLWAVPAATGRSQGALQKELDRAWAGAATPVPTASKAPATTVPKEGSPLARLYVPRLAADWVVVEGVVTADLERGPGHYPSSALPGEVGNFAVAGHRRRGMFWDLDEVRAGDLVIVRTSAAWLVYEVYATRTVRPWEVGVVAANPSHPGRKPTAAELTLTTCSPKWATTHRLVVHARLVSRSSASAEPPTALNG